MQVTERKGKAQIAALKESETVTNIRHLFSFSDKKEWLIYFMMTNAQRE